jgi:hypothetical protein
MGVQNEVGSLHCTAAYNDEDGDVYFGGGNGRLRKIFHMNADGTYAAIADAPVDVTTVAPSPTEVGGGPLIRGPRGKLIIVGVDETIREYTAGSDSWANVDTTPDFGLNGWFAVGLPQYNGLMVIYLASADSNATVMLYKLTTAVFDSFLPLLAAFNARAQTFTPVATDAFNAGSISGSWTNVHTLGSSFEYFEVGADDKVGVGAGPQAAMRRNTGTYSADQYSWFLIDSEEGARADAYIGATCRHSADAEPNNDYYEVRVNWANGSGGSNTVEIRKITNGTPSAALDSGSATFTAGTDEIGILCTGTTTTTITALKNGAAISGITYDDSSSPFTSGTPGMGGAGANWVYGDDWEGGDYSVSGGSSAVPVILQQSAANDDEYERPLVANSR